MSYQARARLIEGERMQEPQVKARELTLAERLAKTEERLVDLREELTEVLDAFDIHSARLERVEKEVGLGKPS